MKTKSWFRLKNYPHIGLPPTEREKKLLPSYIKNKENIAKHSFCPFIHKTVKTRKFRRKVEQDGSRSKLRHAGIKERPIFYANNVDSNIYGYYAFQLQKKYEKILKEFTLDKVPTAYRSIPLHSENEKCRNKCNIDFADEIFSFIRTSKKETLVAMTFDIKSFFDNLDHAILKDSWKKVMGFNCKLPKDHYKVYRNITKFSYVEERDIFNLFKRNIITRNKSGILARKSIAKIKFLKNNNAVAFCELSDIKVLRDRNFIRSNKYEDKTRLKLRKKGIPQGSPISAVLANIYLLEFDKSINKLVKTRHGIYRRYSDDLVIVVPKKYRNEILNKVRAEIKKYNLQIQDEKTQVFWFKRFMDRYYCFEYNLKTKSLQVNTTFEYLGLSFDGKYVRLKSSSLAKYYRKMKRSFRRGHFYTLHNKTKTKGQFFKSRLYKRFTYKGAQRRRIYKRDDNVSNLWTLSHRFDWGNYLTYAFMAQRIIPDNKIKEQIKNHWKNFHKLM